MSDEYVGWGGVTPYTPYTPSPETNKKRASRARKQKSNNAANRKAAALAKRQQAAERKAARKLIAQQKREQRLAKRAARQKRIAEHKKLVALKKAERQREAEERRLAREQKRALALDRKLAREQARKEEKARKAADKALAELRKKTMGTGDSEARIGIAEINNDLPYVEDEAATRNWGIPDGLGGILPLESEVIFDDIEDPNTLLSLGKKHLEKLSKPQISYEADVVSLGRAGFSPDAVGVGDVVQIVDTTFTPPIRVEGRVLKIEEDLLESVDSTRITLGTIQETYTQRRAAQQQKLDELIARSSDWNTAADCGNIYVHDLINRMNELLNARGGYTYLTPDEGILIYDKPEDEHPTKAIQLGGGFWRVADSLKPNGDWDWKNLADGSGIYANRIYTGVLSDAVGKNFWNLDTGEFSLQSTARIGGKTVKQIVDDSADGVISKMNESLTQESIFNKLTNNGETQGIYLSGGHVYLNASYMRTGYLSADMIKTGNLDANLIRAGRIQDYANSNWWDLTNSTIHVSRGEIGGMTITDNAIYNGALELNSRGMYFTDDYGGALGHIGWRRDYSGARMLAFEADSYDTCLGWWSDGRLRMLLDNNAAVDGSGGRSAGFTIWGNLSLTGRSLTNAVIDSSCCVSGGGLNMAVQQFYLPRAIYNGQVTDYQPVRFGFGHGFVIDDNWR
ncbi:phage tail spike protein [Gardnerella vaginalis]|uniref:phage tail spike protein n=1 Tax=Gardnerella vaginalis TaxID=2702 RepID=UPI0039F10030